MFKHAIWLTGMPRSGTNWLSQILASHPDVRMKFCPLFSYEFKNLLDEKSTADEWRNLLMEVYRTKGDYLDQEHLRRDGNIPTFQEHSENPAYLAIKSNRFHNLTPHIIEKCPEIQWVAIVRNPCAAIHSWLSNPFEFPTDADPSQEWRTGACRKQGFGEFWGFDDWKKVTLRFLELEKRYMNRFCIINYESFVANAESETRVLFSALGLDVPKQTLDFIRLSQTSHSDHARAVYKDPVATERWREGLNPEIRKTIERELKDSPLSTFLHNT